MLQQLDARPDTLSQMVYEAIRSAIVDKDLSPGSVVSEAALARTLNVSKTPVREALLRLRELHLVESDERRGLRVVRPSSSAITNAYELRLALEGETAALAAIRASEDQRAEITRLAKESCNCATSNAPRKFREFDASLHRYIAACAGSPLLAAQTENSIALTDMLRSRDAPMNKISMRCAQEHVDLARAISLRQPNSAREIVRKHITLVHERVLADFLQRDHEELTDNEH